MYLSFYKLTREPFNNTPDSAFLYQSPSHREALASVLYGVEMRKGFITITGEVGTGKTTVVRASLEQMDRDRVTLAYIFDPKVDFTDLLVVIMEELGLEPASEKPHALVRQLHRHLIAEYRAGRNVVLIIDEAQNMPVETLENLRMLSNLETGEEKLMQLVLVGQPELEQKLQLEELRQLRQRIAIRARMRSLDVPETLEYVGHRLTLAGADSPERLFAAGVLEKVAQRAGGVPRVINILCDNLLIAGYGAQQRPISKETLAEVLVDYDSLEPGGPRKEAKRETERRGVAAGASWLGWAAALLVGGALVLALLRLSPLVEYLPQWMELDGTWLSERGVEENGVSPTAAEESVALAPPEIVESRNLPPVAATTDTAEAPTALVGLPESAAPITLGAEHFAVTRVIRGSLFTCLSAGFLLWMQNESAGRSGVSGEPAREG